MEYPVSLHVAHVTFTDLDSLAFTISLTTFGLSLCWFVVSMKQWLNHCPWLILKYRRQMLLL
jgi:hypothetical protein